MDFLQATIPDIETGHYSVCVVALPDALDDPIVQYRVREGASQLPVECETVEVRGSSVGRRFVLRGAPAEGPIN